MAQQPAAGADDDLDAAAREAVKRTSATLRKLKLPIATEPVFAFRA
jgi:flavin-binding protein dodecin